MECATSGSASLLLPTQPISKDMDRNIHPTATSTDSHSSSSMDDLPSSPCPSASGSELSFASDAESTDYASTPPTSPTRVQDAFRRSLDASASSSSTNLENLFSNFRIPSTTITPPAAAPKSSKTPIALPVTPSRTRPMLLSSLSSKRGAQSSPGLLDLSSVPRFPSHPSTSAFSSSATTPQGSLTPNGSTPKAVSDRPGLFSRWSTDSEGSGSANDDGEISMCTSPDCEVCEHDRMTAAAEEEMEDMDTDYIRSPLPAGSPSCAASLLPPAPKPHQQGFSPFVEAAPSLSSPAMAPSTSSSYFSQQPRHVSSPASLPASRTCKKKLRNRATYASSSSSGSSDCFLNTPSDSPSADSPMSSPAIPTGPSKPLTRSQGLRIRDEGSRARQSRWGTRSLSAQIAASASASGSPSSTIKTASALLEGTISPAATTTDPLRVKLRQLPGAITPDSSSMPPSPSPLTGSGINHNQPHHQHHHLYNRSLLTPELPRSPLHISSLPNSTTGNRSPNSSKDSSKDIFSKSFSLAAKANRESPLGSPKFPLLPSPRTSVLPSVKENTNPYFAGYA